MLPERRAVLYVDDEESNLIVFEAAFEDLFDVHLASTAQEALELLQKIPVPVVVADQRMPEMTGVEMFQILRQQAPHIQRVILSGYTEPDALIDAINEGKIFQFVRKPWDRAELLSVLKRAMDAHDMLLQNSILREKLVLAERCSMLGQSAARIAHEMGNQLGMLPLIEVIEDDYSNDPQLLELAEVARTTHTRLREFVAEIQSFVRTDIAEDRPVSFSMTGCINELISYLRFNQTMDIARIRLVLVQDSFVIGNPFKLQQVLINLLKNALEATADLSAGIVELRLDQVESQAHITITDNGHGIPEEIVSQIWKPFFTTKGKSGSGLGLDVVLSIVQSHDGKITCESAVGQGTTFEIRLPITTQEVSSEVIEQAHDTPRQILANASTSPPTA